MSLERLMPITETYVDTILKANNLTRKDIDFKGCKTYFYDKGRAAKELVSLVARANSSSNHYYIAKNKIKALYQLYEAQSKTYEDFMEVKNIIRKNPKNSVVPKTVNSDTDKILLNLTSEVQYLKNVVLGLTNSLNSLLREFDETIVETPVNGAGHIGDEKGAS